MELMRNIRESIKKDKFPEFVQGFMNRMFPDKKYPDWAQKALSSVNIILDTEHSDGKQQTLFKLSDEENKPNGECDSSVVK